METPSRAQTERRMEMQARSHVLANAHWLTALHVAERAELNTSSPNKQLNAWKSQGSIFPIQHDGIEYYPAYGFDEVTFRPLKVIAQLIEIFRTQKNGWGIAFWCVSPNSYLGGKRPQDCLLVDAAAVIYAAQREAEGIQHG